MHMNKVRLVAVFEAIQDPAVQKYKLTYISCMSSLKKKDLLLHILKYIFIIIKIQSYLTTSGFLIKYISRTKAELCSIVLVLDYSI